MAKFKLGNIRGPQGPLGVPGKSAYEEWKDRENYGSFDDFLADIGKKGNFVTKDYVDKSKIDDNSYTRFNAINLIFSMMALSKTLSLEVSSLTTVCDDMYIKNNSNFVRVDTKYKCNNKKDVLKLIKNEKYLYIPNSEVNRFFELLEDKIIHVDW